MRFRYFDTCHVDQERDTFWYRVGRLIERGDPTSTIRWEMTGFTHRASIRTWLTLRGATNHALTLNLYGPKECDAVVISIEGHFIQPAVKVIAARDDCSLCAGEAFVRERWKFSQDLEGRWDVR